jgi:hypothetical protein
MLAEGVVIVVSILLAFGIDAWWQERQERQAERQQLSVLRAELAENRAEFEYRLRYGNETLLAQNKLIELIGPDYRPIPSDSLAALLADAWSFGIAEVESGAIDALLDSGEFRTAVRSDLYRLLVRYRVILTDHREEHSQQFIELRTHLLDYLGTVSPGAFVFGRSDFPVPVDDLLRDQQLEAIVSQLVVRTNQMLRSIEDMVGLADSVSVLLDREVAS